MDFPAAAATDAVAARPRFSLVVKADLRPGVTGARTSKVETVERYLSSWATGTRSIRARRPASSSRSAGRTVRS